MANIPVSGPIKLDGQVALVTGAARGIGQAVCLSLAREGAKVAACDVLSCKETIRKISDNGRSALSLQCDVGAPASVRSAVENVISAWGRIDILVNNAAILGDSVKPFSDYGVDEWDSLLKINLRGTFLTTQAVWPQMKAQGGGKITCIGSIAGKIGGILAGPHYCASKGGIHAFVKWAAKHGTGHGIFVNGIAPGPIATPMTASEPYNAAMVPLGRLGQPEDIAEAVLFLSSQASNFITGNILDVNGGMLMA